MGHEHHHHHAAIVTGDPLTIAAFITTLAFSFFASFHCAGMCAPLVHATLGKEASLRQKGIWLYNAGRMLSYTSIGALLGALHATLNAFAQIAGQGLAFVISVLLMLLAALHFMRRLSFSQNLLPRSLKRMISRVTQQIMGTGPRTRAILLGMITALLPCMTLTPAFAGAAATGSALHGFLFMLAFYLGTVPAMLFAPGVPHALGHVIPLRLAQPMSALFLFLTGLVTLLRIYH